MILAWHRCLGGYYVPGNTTWQNTLNLYNNIISKLVLYWRVCNNLVIFLYPSLWCAEEPSAGLRSPVTWQLCEFSGKVGTCQKCHAIHSWHLCSRYENRVVVNMYFQSNLDGFLHSSTNLYPHISSSNHFLEIPLKCLYLKSSLYIFHYSPRYHIYGQHCFCT